ncbi:hypothetical protein JCM11641_004266 [Rhodosporidiobolus odoratus]
MHFLKTALLTAGALVSLVHASPVCTSEKRIAIVKQIPAAYNKNELGGTASGFAAIPFADSCPTFIAADGLPPVYVSQTGNDIRAFGTLTRQVFSHVTGEYTDFANGTTLINTDVTLGIRSIIPLPVGFAGQVYCDFDESCRIKAVPNQILGVHTDLAYVLPQIFPGYVYPGDK